MKEKVTVQNVSQDDMPELLAMHAASWRDTYPNETAGVPKEWVVERTAKWLTPENIEKQKIHAAEAAKDPGSLWKVAKNEKGVVVGLIRASRKDNEQYLGALYVDKNYHGKGIAQALMDAFLEWDDPALTTTLQVAVYNGRAKAFYEKYGFEVIKGSEQLHHDVIPIVTMIRKGKRK